MSRRRRTPPWHAARMAAALILPVALMLACNGSPAPPSPPRPTLEALPPQDLSAVEAGVRHTLEEARRQVDEQRDDASVDDGRLAEAYGRLGSLFHAYSLGGTAAIAYANASVLAPKDPRWPYLSGLLADDEGDPALAATAYRRVLELDPDDAVARLRLGEALLALGEAAAARESFAILVAASGADGEAYRAAAEAGLGRAALALGETEAAAQHLERALELQPAAGALRYPLAQAYRRLGRSEEAQRLLDAGGGEAPSFPDPRQEQLRELAVSAAALMHRGGEALVQGRLEEAEALYRRAVTADPGSAEARRNLAVVLLRAGRPDEAVRVLESALALHPQNALLLFDLANARLAQGQTEAAVAAFKGAVAAAPDFEAAHFNLANALLGQGRWAEARAHLEKVLELAPDDSRARYQLAVCLYQEGWRDEGKERLRELLRRQPDLAAARLSLASILEQEGDLEGARRQLAAILEGTAEASEKASAHAALGRLALDRGDIERALADLGRAAALAPSEVEPRVQLAAALERAGRPGEAADEYGKLLETRPDSPDLRRRQAVALVQAGRLAQAREALEEGLRRQPSDLVLGDVLARLLATAPEPALRDGERALELAQRSYRARPSIDRAETVAMALAERGDTAAAAEFQRRLVDEARKIGDQALAARLEINLFRYEAGQPVRMAEP